MDNAKKLSLKISMQAVEESQTSPRTSVYSDESTFFSLYDHMDAKPMQFSPMGMRPNRSLPQHHLSPPAGREAAWTESDALQRAKLNLESHEEDFKNLIYATEQIATAQRLSNLAHQTMVKTLTDLQCNSTVKAKGSELSALIHEHNLKSVQRAEYWGSNILDVLENLTQTHQATSILLREEYEKAEAKYNEFCSKNPDLDFARLHSPGSSYESTDEELASDSSALNKAFTDDPDSSEQSSKSSSSVASPSTPVSTPRSLKRFFGFNSSPAPIRPREERQEEGEVLKELVEQRRKDFIHSVHILDEKAAVLLARDMGRVSDLYRDDNGMFDYTPDPYQAL